MAEERSRLTDRQKAAYVILEALSPETPGGGRVWVGARAVGNVYQDGAGAKWAGPKLKALVKAGYAEKNEKKEYRPVGPTPEWARVPEPPQKKLKDLAGGDQAIEGMSEVARREMNCINTLFGRLAPKDHLNVLFAAVMKKVGPVQISFTDLLATGDEFLTERVFQWIDVETGELVLKSFPWHEPTNSIYVQELADIPDVIRETMEGNGLTVIVMKPS